MRCALTPKLLSDRMAPSITGRSESSSSALVSGAAAFLALWRATPGFRWPARLLSARPVVAVLDVAYDGFLKIRRLWR